jgi:integrase
MRDFISNFAADLDAMLSYREALGFSRRSHEPALASFDRYAAVHYPESVVLCKKMVTGWIDTQMEKAQKSGIAGKATAIRTFGKYLSAIGKEAYILPDEYVTPPKTAFVPYIFTDEELTRLFSSIDRQPGSAPLDPLKSKIPPVLFRLIYTCGLRPNEGRELYRDSIDFKTGEIFIAKTKRKKDRIVVMSDDMLNLCRKYDGVRESAEINSDYFFPRYDGNAYTAAQLERVFKKCWEDANPAIAPDNLPSSRIYDLRHRFASTVLNNWLDNGYNLYNKLPYLRAFMGHNSLSETVHYIHILPENITKTAGIDWESFEALIPAVQSGVYS